MPFRFRRLSIVAATALTWLIATASASAVVTHTVRRGETLTSIAATDGLTLDRLAAANELSTTAQLVAGTELIIPPQGGPLLASASQPVADPSAPLATTPSETASGGYVVRLGDTLSGIAARLGTTTGALAAANGLSVDGLLLAGRTLVIPGATDGGSSSAAGDTPADSPSATSSPADRPSPVSEFVAPSQVGELAAQDGVSPALAEAIADQESGFNDAEVSSTGAIGVMQIEPGTWRDLTASGLQLSPDSATDNVVGGVALLRSLLAQTGGNQAEAIAAYYQGLWSVRARGMFASTRRYVDDVLALESRF